MEENDNELENLHADILICLAMQSPRVTSLKRPDLHAVGFPSDDRNEPFMKPKMKIVDVPRYEHYDNDDYPLCSAYFMYGDKKETFLFHIPTRNPDFLQIVQLEGPPDGVGNQVADDILIRYGTKVDIPSILGEPTTSEGEIQDPLRNNEFDISFVGIDGEEVTSKVKISRKIWFADIDELCN